MANFDAAYEGTPPWDIGRPQHAFLALAASGALRGRVLDAGCGTGEHAMMAAKIGLTATGIDESPTAIAKAIHKAREREIIDVDFLVGDVLAMSSLGRFDTVLDMGLFHTFEDEERTRYVENLREITSPTGRYFMLCFGDGEPGEIGPRRVSQEEIQESFSEGWHVDTIAAAEIETNISDRPILAWLAQITRI